MANQYSVVTKYFVRDNYTYQLISDGDEDGGRVRDQVSMLNAAYENGKIKGKEEATKDTKKTSGVAYEV